MTPNDNVQKVGWQPITSSPVGVEVMTRIKDENGERNVCSLVRRGNLWFFPDMSMYVYYRPTHWKPLEPPSGKWRDND